MTPPDESVLFRGIAEASDVGIVVSDVATHEVVYINQAFKDLMRLGTSPHPGETCFSYLRGLDAPCKDCKGCSLECGESLESIRHYPNVGLYIRIRSTVLEVGGRRLLLEYDMDVTEDHAERLRQQDLLDLMPAGIGIYEIHGDVARQVYMNEGFLRMVGETRAHHEERVGDDPMRGVHPDDQEAVSRFIRGLSTRDEVATIVYRNLCGDGSYKWLRVSASVVRRIDDTTIVYCGYSDYDHTMATKQHLERVNNQVKAQYELERNRRQFLEQGSLVTITYDVTRDIVTEYRNVHHPQDRSLDNKTGSECVALLRQGMPVESDRALLASRFDRITNLDLFDGGMPERSMDFRVRFDDGCLHWLSADSRMERDCDTGDVVSYVFVRDVDLERKRSLVADGVIDEETDFVMLLSVVSGKAVLLRLRDDYAERGQALGEGFDYDTALFGGDAPVLEGIVPEDVAKVRRFFSRDALVEGAQGGAVDKITYLRMGEDGKPHCKRTRAFYLDDTHEDIVLASRDITDIYEQDLKQQQVLQDALSKAEGVSRAKSEFLSNMSHDIRTPMNAIIGMTQLALDETKEPETREDLQHIKDSSEYLLHILNDILDMSRIESGRFTLNCTWAPPMEALIPCVSMVAPEMESKHIHFEYPQGTGVAAYEYYMDVPKTQRLLMNLLSNALKFTGEGGHVKLAVRNLSHDGSDTCDLLTVSDDGCGMSEGFLRQVFTPFAQERLEGTGAIPGTGLGLALARRTARAMGGDISVTSALGVGTTFSVTLPYRYRLRDVTAPAVQGVSQGQQASLVQGHPQGHGPVDLAGLKVLLCEDNHINALVAQRLLERQGCEVHREADGQAGLTAFSEAEVGAYDVILMDIRMPVLDGLDATRAIRALDRPDAKTVPIIAMSANAYEEDVRASLKVGMDAHLPKPIDPQVLFDLIAELVGRKAQGTDDAG